MRDPINVYLAKLHPEHLRKSARADRLQASGARLFIERSLTPPHFDPREARAKTIAALVVILLALTALFTAAKAQDIPQVLFVSGETLTGPATVEAGYVRLALENRTDRDRAHGIYRVKEGADLEAAKQLVVDEFGGNLTPEDLETAYQTFVDGFYGGAVFIAPGETKEIMVVLEPGRYVVYADYINEQGGPSLEPEQVALLEVTPGGQGAKGHMPEYTVRMVDHAFALPPDIKAGRHLWRVETFGHQDHLMFIWQLLPGQTIEDVLAFVRGEAQPPFVNVLKAVGVHALSFGLGNDVWLELEAGDYAAICFITDPETGMPHAMLGMTQVFTVSEEGH